MKITELGILICRYGVIVTSGQCWPVDNILKRMELKMVELGSKWTNGKITLIVVYTDSSGILFDNGYCPNWIEFKQAIAKGLVHAPISRRTTLATICA
jgi:hypothetical protein